MFNQSPSIIEVSAALVGAQSELKEAICDSRNPHFKNDYASLKAFIAIVRPVLAKYGLCLVSGVVPGELFETTILHKSGEWISYQLPLILAKNDMQGLGSAITYARRYGLAAILNMDDTDDDGNLASKQDAPKTFAEQKPKIDKGLVQELKKEIDDAIPAWVTEDVPIDRTIPKQTKFIRPVEKEVAPKCSLCGAEMAVSKNGATWYCPKWKEKEKGEHHPIKRQV